MPIITTPGLAIVGQCRTLATIMTFPLLFFKYQYDKPLSQEQFDTAISSGLLFSTTHDLSHNRRQRFQEQFNIQPKRLLLLIDDIKTHHFGKSSLVLPADLPETRQPWNCVKPLPVPREIFLSLVGDTGSRSHKTHLATKHIDELGQLIETGFTKD